MLDSNICLAVLRRQDNLRRLPPPSRCFVSQITVAELWTGVEKGTLRDQRAIKLEEMLSYYTLLDFDEPAARVYAEIRATLEKRGKIIGPFDLLIAAHARSVGATMLTGNFSEFNRVPGLKVLRWK
jgi:tRNA(fMet)-specific endonuclease VapC